MGDFSVISAIKPFKRVFSSCEARLPNVILEIKAAEVAFSLAEARLLDERSKKNTASAAFSLKLFGGAAGYCLRVQITTRIPFYTHIVSVLSAIADSTGTQNLPAAMTKISNPYSSGKDSIPIDYDNYPCYGNSQ